MHPIIEALEGHGLISEDAIATFVFRSSPKKVFALRDSIAEILDAEFYRAYNGDLAQPQSPFTFLAGSSMRGEGCNSWVCRLNRVNAFARYSALYCDRVYLPIQVTGRTHYLSETEELEAFGLGMASILELRPLVESGIVCLQPHVLNVCPRCLREKTPSFDAIARASRQLKQENHSKFTVSYLGNHPREVRIRGPEEFLEHREVYLTLSRKYRWQRKSDKRTVKMTSEEIEKSHLLDDIFRDLEDDALVQQFYGLQCGAKYLTDRLGEIALFRKLASNDWAETKMAALCKQLTHDVPLLNDVPLESVVKLRKEEPEAFDNYLSAISKIVRQHISPGVEVGAREAKEIYSDILYPELAALEAKSKALRSGALKKALIKTSITTAVLAVGIFGGFVPAQMLAIFKALGGAKVASEIGEAYANIERNPAEVRSHNMYFLLRLKQQG